MLAHDTIEVRVVAELRLLVPRDAPGDLVAGTRAVVAAVDGVIDVETVEVASITPNLNDLFVDATVTAIVRLDGAFEAEREAVRSVLLDGFGVDRVDALAIDRPEAGDRR